jgi:hypothetical protein
LRVLLELRMRDCYCDEGVPEAEGSRPRRAPRVVVVVGCCCCEVLVLCAEF